MSHCPGFFCHTCHRYAPLTTMRLWRDVDGRNRRVCQICHGSGATAAAVCPREASLTAG